VNAPFPTGFGDAEYVSVYTKILAPIALEYKPELVLVSAGFDPFFKDPLGGMKLTGEGFGALAGIVKDIALQTCDGKVLMTLEGGYDPEGLRSGVRAVLRTFIGRTAPVPTHAPSALADEVIARIVSVHNKYWKSLK
jgi:acetoin utilization deacetylase AcuC-like enzyme